MSWPRLGLLLLVAVLAGQWLTSASEVAEDARPVAHPGRPSPLPTLVATRRSAEGQGVAVRPSGDGPEASSPALPTIAGTAPPAASASLGPPPTPLALVTGSPLPSATAAPITPTSTPFTGLRVPVLTYHVIAPWSIAQPYASTDSDVLPERFDAQLAALRVAGWRTVTADAIAEALERGRTLPPRTFVIAIDDGHDDGYDFAFPIIRRHGYVATYYVIAGRLESGTYLSWPELRAMQAAGMEIGNHTLSHLELPTLTPAEVLRQVAGAQAAFEAQLERAPTTFAYPFGRFDDVAIAAVRATGLRLAFTTRKGQVQTWAARYTLPRVHVGGGMTPAQLLAIVNEFL